MIFAQIAAKRLELAATMTKSTMLITNMTLKFRVVPYRNPEIAKIMLFLAKKCPSIELLWTKHIA